MELDQWQEQKYQTVFDDVCAFIDDQRQTNPDFTRAYLEAMLEQAYKRDGNDWEGRGLAYQITLSATIAAYEQRLADWRNESA